MAFSIALTLGQRDNLLTLQNVERYQTRTQKRLSSGREVNDVVDDVFRYFAGRSLSDRADEFIGYRVQIEQAISSLKTAVDTIDSINNLFQQIRGVVKSSAGKTQVALIRLGSTLLPTLEQIGNVIIDSHYQGVNQLIGDGKEGINATALSVRFSDKYRIEVASLDVFGSTSTNSGSVLVNTDYSGAGQRFISYNAQLTETVVNLNNVLRFQTVASSAGAAAITSTITSLAQSSGKGSILNRIVDNLGGVIRNLNVRAQELGTYIGLLQTRSEFNRNYGTEHLKGSDKYTLADINQEGAYLVALQTRQQLSLNALAVSGRQQNAVLTLFS